MKGHMSCCRAKKYVLLFLTWSFSSRSMFCFFNCAFVFSSLSSRSESSGIDPTSNISSCKTWYSTSYACSCLEMSISITWQNTGKTVTNITQHFNAFYIFNKFLEMTKTNKPIWILDIYHSTKYALKLVLKILLHSSTTIKCNTVLVGYLPLYIACK